MNIRGKERLASLEAVLALWVGWVLVFVVPFRITTAWLGGASAPACQQHPATGQNSRAQCVAQRVARLAPRAPWRTTCLVQAVAGYLLLKRRNIESVIRLGVNADKKGLAAHAWLIVGDQIVLGGAVSEDYRPLADLGTRPNNI